MSKSLRNQLFACAAALAVVAAGAPSVALAADKPKIESAAQLPRQTYTLSKRPSEFIEDAAAVAALARRLDSDVAALLAQYDIQDRSTLEGLYGVRLQVALLENRWADARTLLEQTAAIREKPADKAVSGLTTYALLAGEQASGSAEAKRAAYRQALTQRLSGLDYALVEARVKSAKSSFELMNPSLVGGAMKAAFDPIWEKSPEISRDMAAGLVGAFVSVNRVAPYKDEAVAAMNQYLAANASSAPRVDIWTPRTVTLPASASLTPVVIGIWDSGVDAPVFKDRIWTNPREKANGRDDDGNGFVDDLHGIGYEVDFKRSGDTLRPVPPEFRDKLVELRGQMKGALDLQGAVDSPEAAALRQRVAQMKPEEIKSFTEGSSFYSNYAHGSHVAGIAAEGNPAARILPVRFTFPHTLLPPAMDEAFISGYVRHAQESVAYMKRARVRVANMSWRLTAPAIEATLEIHRLEMDPEKRKARAQKLFDQLHNGLRDAFASAPEILFVAGAGNENQDINFVRSVPAGIDLPNVITVGAVDQTGGSTSFTSLGKSVDIYANGFEVVSYVPGGERIKLSGTSMSAPQVTNAAAKLLAVNPKLTTAQLVDLLTRGASKVGQQELLLLNPRQSLSLAGGARSAAR